jgi:hypothetical protein
MASRNIVKWLYLVISILRVAFCYVGTLVGLAYHSREPFAPQVLEGIATALIPLGILYLLLAYFGVFKSRKEI